MTELLIDGRRVVLPQSLNMQVIEENPFFTKNGVYTLDITLSLEGDENAKIYEHINRIHVVDNIGVDKITGKPSNRSAILIVDNEVVLNGTEIITEISNTTVTIQLVSGNSELNFLVGGDKKLRDLELGNAYVYEDIPFDVRKDLVLADLKKGYPDRDFQLLPYVVEEGQISTKYFIFPRLGNSYSIINSESKPEYIPAFNPFMSGSVPQPYLCFIVKKVIESLGYTLEYNAIAEHPVLSQVYIVHGFKTKLYSKMLPSWTVNEFFAELENWLNCVVIVNPFARSVRILFEYQGFSDNDELIVGDIGKHTIEIEDDFTIERNNENLITKSESNIGYSLDNEIYYKYMKLDDSIRSKASDIVLANDIPGLLADINNIVSPFKNIITLYDTVDRFIIYQIEESLTLKKVDSFKDIRNNPDSTDLDIELNIIPAPMAYGYFGWEGFFFYWLQAPIAADADPLEELADPKSDVDVDDLPLNIQATIEGDTTTNKEQTYSKMRVAMYTGLQQLDRKSGLNDVAWYPISYVESLCEYFQESKKERYFGAKGLNPFRLDYLKAEIYDKSESIDTTKIYKLAFTNPGKVDIMSKFIANNKAFRCVKIEKTITIDGFDEKVKGDFYPYNINRI